MRATLPVLILMHVLAFSSLADDNKPWQIDRDENLEIEAGSMEYSQETRTLTLFDDVQVTQGTLRISAQRIVVRYDDESDTEVSMIEAFDSVSTTSRGSTAKSDTASYDVKSGDITLRGNVRLVSAGAVMTGGEAQIDLDTGESRLIGGADRVNILLSPGAIDAEDVPEEQ